MRSLSLIAAALAAVLMPSGAEAREIVDASDPINISVTIYRDPDRGPDDELDASDPGGFAMISETRRVTLPPGESTIRFIGVAEGMVGVSAIVTGLPGGTIEKNRNAELLSPAALVNGALGNRVRITRTDPATGRARSEDAIVRTRADGGLVLQTEDGFEAVRCSGLPEKLTFNRVPDGLYAKPLYSVDTRSEEGGTYEVTLTYISWGFDWQANYVATLPQDSGREQRDGQAFDMQLLSWLTLVNDNGQSFNDATLQIVAGRLNIDTDFEGLSDPPSAQPLRLTCYPFGSTAAGSPFQSPGRSPFPPPPMAPEMMADDGMIVVTATRRQSQLMESPVAVSVVSAEELDLGDLKLFRVPVPVNVSAQGMKQVAFLNRNAVEASFLYLSRCDPQAWVGDLDIRYSAMTYLVTKNEAEQGLGVALPQGQLTLYEPTARGPQLGATAELRDYARGQDVELELVESTQVFTQCGRSEFAVRENDWNAMWVEFTNANPHPVTVRLRLGRARDWQVRYPDAEVLLKDGWQVVDVVVPANYEGQTRWYARAN